MSKLKIASPDIQKLVQDIAEETGMCQFIKFQALNTKKSKEVVKVKKATPETEALSDKEVIVIVYEDAFDRVDEATQIMWLRSEMSKVSYDLDKDKVIINNRLISVPIDFYQKYGESSIRNAELAILTISQLDDEEKERKALAKASKNGKRKNKNF